MAGLELRGDSKLCSKWVSSGEPDISYVVRRMCEMKWLHEYTGFQLRLTQALHDARRVQVWLDVDNIFAETEQNVLVYTPYPAWWPWLEERYATRIQRAWRCYVKRRALICT